MPYPNEHAARVRDPSDFDKSTYARLDHKNKPELPVGVSIIVAKLKQANKPSDAMVTQTYRFDRTKFSPAEVKKWLDDHEVKGYSFEPASEKEAHEALHEAGPDALSWTLGHGLLDGWATMTGAQRQTRAGEALRAWERCGGVTIEAPEVVAAPAAPAVTVNVNVTGADAKVEGIKAGEVKA